MATRRLVRRVLRDERGAVGAPQRASTRDGAGDYRRVLTLRKDYWWLPPLVTSVVLLGFVVYATVVAFIPKHFYVEPYLSPFYSPCLAESCPHKTLGFGLSWWKISPALLILPAPLLFRSTCYYYRKAYYRAFWWAPPACAVADAGARYSGESKFPLIVQNLHRYGFYLALPFPFILLWDGLQAFRFEDGIGMGVGTVVLILNAVLLGAYTFSCHSCRHLCGGHVDRFSKAPRRYQAWQLVTKLNEKHMEIAWVSLFGVALTDLYVRLVSMGVITDIRFF